MIDVQDHLGLAKLQAGRIYKKFQLSYRYDFDDILQMCHVGLIKAAQKFDKTKGYTFSTYALSLMYGYVLNTILRDKYYPSAERNGSLNSHVLSLDINVNNSMDKEVTYKDAIMDKQEFYTEFTGILVRTALEKLPSKHREVIKLRYFQGKTQMQIAKLFGTSQTTIGRFEKEGLTKLRRYVS
ncbi:sigma-70 family RNA polymerase sigma factor [Clostridium pasteurianum]|uniref:RNA polymerase sigma factor, sigma-70 family n=1 Tax=Clostridium pasteurianum BC1 TaxID=86416 RepID=R4K5X9_CLOPA|nr:sigma-70 family RNA polymerase sigma factor [Clostridium pasteurianum]AGK97973.1 RNA polymerase sigma factor, sigma-70 family [Clostridium pasteurianum BC1]